MARRRSALTAYRDTNIRPRTRTPSRTDAVPARDAGLPETPGGNDPDDGLAFPHLTGKEHDDLAAIGIDAEQSLSDWLTDLSGAERAAELMVIAPERGGGQIGLTDRELEVLGLYAQGLNQSEIGGRLHLSKHTVYDHMRNARMRLGARTIAHAVHLAHEDGLL